VLGAALGFAVPRLMTESASAVHPNYGMVCTNGPTFNLRASDGYVQTPDGNSVYMWSFQKNPGFFQYPGPVLCVNQGDTVTVNLTNDLPEPVSIIFPGQSNVLPRSPSQPQFDGGGNLTSLTQVAAPAGGTVSYSFVAEEPGTYIYESGTESSKQVQMGLVGALVIRPSLGANYAYNDVSTLFNPDREFLLLFHEIDPDLHHASSWASPFDVTLTFRYWTVNGRALPDSIQINNTLLLPSQPYSPLVVGASRCGSTLSRPIRLANPAWTITLPPARQQHSDHRPGRPAAEGPGGEDLSFEQFGRTTACRGDLRRAVQVDGR
jgi:hypothetical protein